MLELETIIAKIQFEVDNSENALYLEDQEEVRKHLKGKNHKLREKLKKWRERKWTSSPTVQIMGVFYQK